jgi:hypothetical protein
VVVSNLGPGNRLYIDRIKVNSIDTRNAFGYILDRASLDKPAAQIVVTLPYDDFIAARTAHSEIQIQLWATKLRLTAERPLLSVPGGSIDDHGRCERRTAVRFGKPTQVIDCVSTRPIGDCFGITDPSHPVRTGGMIACRGLTYAPWPLPLWRDAYYSVWLSANDLLRQFRADPAADPPNASAQIITNYVPDEHMVRALSLQAASAIERAGSEGQSVDGAGAAARFASPASVVVDKRGNLFIVDGADSVIRKITPTGEVSTVAGKVQQTGRNDGTAQEARFTHPLGIAIDGADNLLIADTGNGLIRKITPAGIVSTLTGVVAEGGNREVLHFENPRSVIYTPDGTLYVIDSNAPQPYGNPVVRKISAAGVVSTIAGPEQPVGRTDNGGMVLELPAEELRRD